MMTKEPYGYVGDLIYTPFEVKKISKDKILESDIPLYTTPRTYDTEAKLKEIQRLKLKCNQLIGLCKSASGYLFDADLVDKSNLILDAVPGIEQSL